MTSLGLLEASDNQLYGSLPAGLDTAAGVGALTLSLDVTVCATLPLPQSDYEVRCAFACMMRVRS